MAKLGDWRAKLRAGH